MEINLKLEEIIRAYLLGKLSPGEQEKLEGQLMSQDDTFTQVLIQEDELIDEYVSGALPAHERDAFERHFLAAPVRRQKLEFAQALTKYIDARTPVSKRPQITPASFAKVLMAMFRLQQPLVQYSFAAIALLLTLGIAWPIVEVVKLKSAAEQMRAHQTTTQIAVNNLTQQLSQEQKRSQDLMEQLGQQEQSRSALEEQLALMQRPAIVSFPALTPGQVRDIGATKKLVVPPAARLVELSLAVDGENYSSYRATLQGASGEEVLILNRLNGTRRDGIGVVAVPIPAGLLGPGDYSLKLSGLKPGGAPEDIGKYYFRVLRK